ncbi:hypothetical protein JCM3765_006042 [Sporobolomyces pararoseus]
MSPPPPTLPQPATSQTSPSVEAVLPAEGAAQTARESHSLQVPVVKESKKTERKKSRNKSIDLTQRDPNDRPSSSSSTSNRWFNRSPASSSSSSLVLPDQQPQQLSASSPSSLSPDHSPANDTLPLPTSKPKGRTGRSRSIGSLHLLTNALSRTSSSSSSSSSTTANIRPVTPPSPTSRTQSTTSVPPSFDPTVSQPSSRPVLLGQASRKPSSSSTSSTSSSLLQVAASSFKHKRSKSKKRTQEDNSNGTGLEEEWSAAELEEGDETGRIFSEEMTRAKSTTSSEQSIRSGKSGKTSASSLKTSVTGNGGPTSALGSGQGSGSVGGGGKFVQSLRRTRSKLGLIAGGKGKESEETSLATQSPISLTVEPGEGMGEDGTIIQSPVMTFVEPPSPSDLKTFDQELAAPPLRSDETPMIISTSPTMDSFSSSTSPSSPSSAPTNTTTTATQRIGGWFSSMLNNSTSSPSSRPSSVTSSPATSPEKQQQIYQQPRQRTHSSHSPSSTRNFFSSPTKNFSHSSLSLPPSSNPASSPTQPSLPTSASRLGPLDRMLDKAVQYFLDTDSNADKCQDDIWLLGGVKHEGWRPPPPSLEGNDRVREDSESGSLNEGGPNSKASKRWSPIKTRASKQRERQQSRETIISNDNRNSRDDSPTPSLRSFSTTVSGESSTLSFPSPSPSSSDPATALPGTTINGWPSSFFLDFYSRPALTYRSNFVPIPCSPSKGSTTSAMHGMFNSLSLSIGRGGSSARDSNRGGGSEENGLSSDTGWGCMLRTGQSLLANALVTAHLGRDWRRPLPLSPLPSPSPHGQPAPPASTAATLPPSYPTYTRILSLFLDTPSRSSPFSVHKFALEGQRLGKSVGEWFGPSTAAGAIKKLVNDFEPAGMKVVSCVDGTLYENEVVAASTRDTKWDTKVLVLINLRLGIDGVNPIYHEAIKGIFRIPQSVGIAGGRPSSSYYFVGSQANSLFYIDPHHPRPAISTIDLPSELESANLKLPLTSVPTGTPDLSNGRRGGSNEAREMLNSFFSTAYDDSAWRSYHCDKVRKCALSSLDPSMLVGFLIQDEEDWDDFKLKARELGQNSSAIFSIAPSPPKWMRRSSSAALPPPQMSASPGDDSFSELDEDSIVHSPSANAGGTDGGLRENFEEDDVEFSEPEGWELDSTDASDSNSLQEAESSRDPVPTPTPGTVLADEEEKSDDENDPIFVDSRTSMHSRESTRGTH